MQRDQKCARLAASQSPADRRYGLAACSSGLFPSLLPDPPEPAPPATSPVPINSCDRIGCWDNAGVHYFGRGMSMLRSDGRACREIATMINCD